MKELERHVAYAGRCPKCSLMYALDPDEYVVNPTSSFIAGKTCVVCGVPLQYVHTQNAFGWTFLK